MGILFPSAKKKGRSGVISTISISACTQPIIARSRSSRRLSGLWMVSVAVSSMGCLKSFQDWAVLSMVIGVYWIFGLLPVLWKRTYYLKANGWRSKAHSAALSAGGA